MGKATNSSGFFAYSILLYLEHLKIIQCRHALMRLIVDCLEVFLCFSCLPPSVEALTFPPSSGKSFIMGADEALESELGLGELAGLTVANEADSLAYDVSSFIFVVSLMF